MKILQQIIISLAVVLGVLVAYQRFYLSKHSKKLYSLDVKKIIKLETKLSQNADGTIDYNKMSRIDNKVREYINFIAKRDNANILTIKAFVSNPDKDITKEVIYFINTNFGGM